MPLLTTRAGASSRAFGFGAAGTARLNYLGMYGSSAAQVINGVIAQPDGGTTLVGYGYNGVQNNAMIVWVKPTGQVDAVKFIEITGSQLYSGAYDSSGNLYVVGDDALRPSIYKLDSSKNFVWARRLNQNSSSGSFKSIKIGASGSIYVCGSYSYGFTSGGGGALLAKYNSSGTNLWYQFGPNTYHSYDGMDIDSSENIYVTGNDYNGNRFHLSKYDTSGTRLWLKYDVTSAAGRDCVYLPGSDRVIVAGDTQSIDGSNQGCVYAINASNGNLVTSTSVDTTFQSYFYSVVKDSAGNAYTFGQANYSTASASQNLMVCKWDSNLNLNYQRQWDMDPSTFNSTTFAKSSMDSFDNIHIGFSNSNWAGGYGGNDAFYSRLPTDGSKTGTYTLNSRTVYYEAGAGTLEFNSVTNWNNYSMSMTNSLTAETITPTVATGSLLSNNYVVLP